MAAVTLPKPGTQYGPCAGDCAHIDCAETRRMVAQVCHFCGVQIGYDVRFYSDPDDPTRAALVHARCLEDSVDVARKARATD